MIRVDNLFIRKEGFSLSVSHLEFHRAEKYIVIGPSGSGKSTLLRVIVGLEPIERGRIEIDGKQISAQSGCSKVYQGIYLLSQEDDLWPHLSVREHIRFVLNRGNLRKKNKEEDSIIEDLQLQDIGDSKPHQLSWGQRRKLALARALAADVRYLLLDEPFANIDMVQAKELTETVYRLSDMKDIAVIQVTHYPFIPKEFTSIILVQDAKIYVKSSLEEIAECTEWAKSWKELVR